MLALRTVRFACEFLKGGGTSLRGGALFVVLALCGAASAQEVAAPATVERPSIPVITQVKPLCLETPLVEGASAIPIVVPADGSRDADAAVIANAIEAAGAARPALIKDDAFRAGLTLDHHCIALGNRSTNKLLGALYDRHFSLTDLRYPGPGGHEVRTLHNPLGNGKNVIIVGGSDAAGVTNGALLFAQKVAEARKSESGLVIGRLMEIQLGAGVTPPMDLEQFETWDASAIDATGAGWNSISKRMAMYYMTGDPFHANEALRLAFPNDQAKAELEILDGARIEQRNTPLSGTRPEFACRMVLYWDLIEESPVFSDDDRLRVTQALAQQVSNLGFVWPGAGAASAQSVGTTSEQWTAIAQYSLGRYFAKDYADPLWVTCMESGAAQFRPLYTHAWVRGEGDAPGGYGKGIAPVLNFILLSGDRVPVENGVLAALLRGQEILASGRDGDPALVQAPISFFHQAASLIGDGRWLEYGRRTGIRRDGFRVGQSWSSPIAPSAPSGFSDTWQVQAVPAALWLARNSGLANEETFQFMSYRSAADATGDFILLDGLHGDSREALALLALRQDGQTVLEGESNRLSLRGDAPVGPVQSMDAALKLQHVLGEIALVSAEVPNTGLANWRRTILNRRSKYSLLLDTVVPHEDAANFEIQLTWERPQAEWAVGPGASCLLLPGSVDPAIRPTLQTSRPMGLSIAGDRATLVWNGPVARGQAQHLFSAIGRGPVGSVACVPLGANAAALHLPQPAVVAAGAFEGMDGTLTFVTPDYVYGVALTAARELVRADAPIEIAWDLNAGIIDVVTSKPTTVSLALEGPEKLRIDRTPLTGEVVDARLRINLDAGRHRITGANLTQGRLDVNTAWINDTVNKALAEAQPAVAP